MKLTIVADDQVVIVNGRAIQPINMDGMGGVLAVQWDGFTGHEELTTGKNVPLANIEKYQFIIDRWQAAADAIDNPPPPTRDELLAQLITKVNQTTDQLIVSGFKYPDENGQSIRMLVVDQQNFEGEKNMYAELAWDGVDISGYFPLQIKVNKSDTGAPVFMTINSLDEYKTFVRAGKMYIRQCLADGWSIKADLQGKTLEELQAWSDPRI